jgi:nitrogen fixation/metabolism regulation signal transduction histidine kinase
MERWLEFFARTNFERSGDTAHDLKTPLNVAVLNLELLRMRVAKLFEGQEDAKVDGYLTAIETELRRMARIFDAFFLLSTPPRGEEPPGDLDLAPLCREAASEAGYQVDISGPTITRAHESRIRQALQMFFEGTSKLLKAETRDLAVERGDRRLHLTVTGRPQVDNFELTKILKFYHTDADGNPDLALAATRLIVETYGGELKAAQERDKVSIRLSFPLGER